LASFEVLEHMVDPVAELATMMSRSPNVFVSTLLLPIPAPRVSDWWYYSPLSGQHISFFTLDALQLLACRFGRHLLSRQGYHLFTSAPKSKLLFRLATSRRASPVLSGLRRRPSLTDSDSQFLMK
jgi:hypothetical protein